MADKRQNDNKNEKKRKESILDLSKYLEKQIRVKFAGKITISFNSHILLLLPLYPGGRECSGVLKGFDPLLNLVLDNTTEYLRDPGNFKHVKAQVDVLIIVTANSR